MARGPEPEDRGTVEPPRIRRIPPPPNLKRSVGFTLKTDFWKNKQRLWTIFAIAALLISFLAGIVYYWNQRSGTERDYVEIYVTDLPADFSSVDVTVAGVYVGVQNYSVPVEHAQFDLLSLHGPDDALRIASGEVPAGDHQEIRIVFDSVEVGLNGAKIRLDMPDPVLLLGHSLGLEDGTGSAFLFDFNLDQSIVVTENGLSFRPQVDAIYIHHYGSDGTTQIPGVGPAPDHLFKDDPSQPVDRQKLEKKIEPTRNPFTGLPTTSTSRRITGPTPTTSKAPPTTTPGGTPTDPLTSEPDGWLPDPGDIDSIPDDPGDPGGWFVRFIPDEDDQQWLYDLVESTGAQIVFMFGSQPAAYVMATPEQAQVLSELPGISYVEADQAVVLNDQSSFQSIRLPEAQNPLWGLRDNLGRPVTGQGVGVAIIDIGFDGTHPDLMHHVLSTDPAFLVNYKVESLFQVDAPNTDETSGHGTHVAGILAGRGISDPTQRGVAYGSSLYGFAIGEASTTLWPNVALDWIVQNHDKVDPPIRVVSNSWGSGSNYDPQSLTSQLVEKLVDEGVVVVFSAGNAGGDGSLAATTSQCQIPKEGVVCVGAMDDHDLGQREGTVASYSSRGKITSPPTWPDLVAPGTDIRSARPLFGTETGLGLVPYTELSGTSMAAPHVAGAAALMFQMDPTLTPDAVEKLLEESAYKFTDGGAYGVSADYRFDGANYAKGHGLLDVFAAVQLAGSS